jgi:hypothetical protein
MSDGDKFGDIIMSSGTNLIGVTDEQAKAAGALSEFGKTAITEVGALARYFGRILGTVPEYIVGFVIGDPLHFVRTAIAKKYDDSLNEIFERRKSKPEPVSPSVAIPLLRAAYDESRPELQELWAQLIATAMDPSRASRFRLSFIDTLKKFDPLDALLLRKRIEQQGNFQPNDVTGFSSLLGRPQDEVELSRENLVVLKCCWSNPTFQYNFSVTTYGRALYLACSE